MSSHTCVLNNYGLIKCWGKNDLAQLGFGDDKNRGDNANEMGLYLPYVSIGDGLKIDQVSTGGSHTCVHLTNNQIKCWGSNKNGQIGIGLVTFYTDISSADSPNNLDVVQLGSTGYPTKVYCGASHTCVLLSTKQVKCFGSNKLGQIGFEGVTTSKGKFPDDMGDNLPTLKLGTGVTVQQMHTSAGASHNCVILATSQLLKCWGQNGYGQLGYGDTADRGQASGSMGDNLNTVDLGTEKRVRLINIGFAFTCAVRVDEILVCFGNNFSGQFGIGTTTSPISDMGTLLTPTTYDAGKKIKQISSGLYHNCILYDDNITVKCIGLNASGQLGQGDKTNRGNSPTNKIPDIPAINFGTGSLSVSYITALDRATCVVFIDYSVKCFGSGLNGKLGYGQTNDVGTASTQMGSNLPFVELYLSLTYSPTNTPTTSSPTNKPVTLSPTNKLVTSSPTTGPITSSPTNKPVTLSPTNKPATSSPTAAPITSSPTNKPTTLTPSNVPTTVSPTKNPSRKPTKNPSFKPTSRPSATPTINPSKSPITLKPTIAPNNNPSTSPTSNPSMVPTLSPISAPSTTPTTKPTKAPKTAKPTIAPAVVPTSAPNLLCGYDNKKKCIKDKGCQWKKTGCSVIDCQKYSSKDSCVNDLRCIWQKKKCRFKTA